eukprot:UN3389
MSNVRVLCFAAQHVTSSIRAWKRCRPVPCGVSVPPWRRSCRWSASAGLAPAPCLQRPLSDSQGP